MKSTLRLLRIAIVLLVLMVAGVIWLVLQPYRGFSNETFVEIERRTPTMAIGMQLEKAGVVRHRLVFAAAKLLNPGGRLQAGEYRFSGEASALSVYRRIARGDVFYYSLTVPEGKNIFEIAETAGELRLFSGPDFLNAAKDPALIRDLDPRAESLEGYLFPDTYRLTRHTTPYQLCAYMTARFRSVWTAANATRNGAADVHRTVTLASLVEREAKLPAERGLVASVFQNRLNSGMKLDCDPTVVYAALLENRYRGTIYRSDLENPSPYNTYKNPGLPPGPIANAGSGAIKAALTPEPTKYLYFVAKADGSGGHNFSTSLAAHEEAVARYRRAIKSKSD